MNAPDEINYKGHLLEIVHGKYVHAESAYWRVFSKSMFLVECATREESIRRACAQIDRKGWVPSQMYDWFGGTSRLSHHSRTPIASAPKTARSLAFAKMGKKGGKVAAKRLSPEQRMARAAKGGEATRARFMEKISIDRTTLENNMDVLDERERRIIIEYFGLSGEQPKSLRCTAKTTGLTAQRVHQLLNITLDEIKECQSKRGA